MALSRAQLSTVQVVSAGNTTAVATVADNKKIFVKSIMAHNKSALSHDGKVYIVPNGGSVSESTRMFNVTVDANETVFIEPAYPITIAATGDTIQCGAASTSVNFFITGDKEA